MSRQSKFLSREEEQALALRWKQGDERAMHKLVVAHFPLADKIARKYGVGRDVEELRQEAYIGLMQAVRRFDPERGLRFSTFAQHWAKAAVTDFIFRNDALVRGPSHSAGKMKFWRGDGPKVISMETPIGPDGLTFGDTFVDGVPLPDAVVEVAVDGESKTRALHEQVDALDPRSRDIVLRRHLTDEPQGLQEIGDDYSISKERVRQIESKALKTLAKRLNPGRALV